MIEELDFETYLSISSYKFQIYLLDKKKLKNLYFQEYIIQNEEEINLNSLKDFLDKNIFKIEKLIGQFIKNISLIIENKNIFNLKFGINRKNYQKIINKKILLDTLIEAKDLFNENYKDCKIIHMLIKRYLIGDHDYFEFYQEQIGSNIKLEIQFIVVPNNFIQQIDRVLEKYQIKIDNYLCSDYIKTLALEKNSSLSEMAYKIQMGYNKNEVILKPQNSRKTGFFEKFFQLFS